MGAKRRGLRHACLLCRHAPWGGPPSPAHAHARLQVQRWAAEAGFTRLADERLSSGSSGAKAYRGTATGRRYFISFRLEREERECDDDDPDGGAPVGSVLLARAIATPREPEAALYRQYLQTERAWAKANCDRGGGPNDSGRLARAEVALGQLGSAGMTGGALQGPGEGDGKA